MRQIARKFFAARESGSIDGPSPVSEDGQTHCGRTTVFSYAAVRSSADRIGNGR